MTTTIMTTSMVSWMKTRLFTTVTMKEIGALKPKVTPVTTQSQSLIDCINPSRIESSTVMNCPRCTRYSSSRRTWKSVLSLHRYLKLIRDQRKEPLLVIAQMSNHSIEMSNNFSKINKNGLSNSRLLVREKKEKL